MQYVLFDELAAVLRLRALERIDLKRVAEIREIEASLPHLGLRRSVAGALVALGVRLDQTAGERALAGAGARAAR